MGAAMNNTAAETCSVFGATGELFGYFDADDALIWYCGQHKLREWSADRHHVPAVKGETPPTQTLEELAERLHHKIDEGIKVVEDLQLECGRMLLEMRHRVEAGEAGDVTWWQWFETRFPPDYVSRKHIERWMGIASKADPEAAAVEYRERAAGYQRSYRERISHRQCEIQTQPEPEPPQQAHPAPKPTSDPVAVAEAFIPKVVEQLRRMTIEQRKAFRWKIDEAMRESNLDVIEFWRTR
jgi:hypothetical protein